MSRLLSAAALLASLLGSTVYAEQRPQSGGYSAHVKVVAYNPMNVVLVTGSATNSTQIIFAPGEEITQVAIGDADAWLAQPTGNLLFIKPTKIRNITNMQVVTRRPSGGNRSYQFRLLAARRGTAGPTSYAINFTYPEDERAARAANLAKQEAAEAERRSQAQLAGAWTEGRRNWRYVAQGSVMVEPAEVSDNGRQTAFRFPGNMRVPTIYTAALDGTEAIVPYTAVNDMIVVQTTARIFTLRDGQEVLRVINQGFDPVGHNPGTGTGTPELTRHVKGAHL